ncbi:MAG: hypothetical protein HZB91_03950 [Elusimicrobia bacterium]|nr:hypothetical protein [Elusimicrobiota bacterium]
MIPWRLLDTAAIPGDTGELQLYQRGAEFSMRANGGELMNSLAHGSEDELADLTCARLPLLEKPVLLVGGLGMGFTLAAALRRLGPGARLVVAELVPAVVRWNRDSLGHLAEHPLRDGRVELRVEDVADTLKARRRAFDAVLLDVDNGPRGFTSKANDWLYSDLGLEAAAAALRDRGILAQWSCQADRSYVARLRKAGFSVEEVHTRGRKGKGSHNKIWLSTRKP